MKKYIVLVILTAMVGFIATQLAWTQVNTDGFGDVNNETSTSMAVYNGNLYVGTDNWISGTEVWQYNGTTWDQVNTDGFGGFNFCSPSMAFYGEYLYVGTYNPNGAEIWQYNGTSWNQVTTDGFGDWTNSSCESMVVYNGSLYVGTDNSISGTEVWQYNGTTWDQVNTDGFGDPDNEASTSMAVYNGNLYVGTDNTEVWQYNGTSWNQVTTDGFGDGFSVSCESMAVYNGSLYVGTYNPMSVPEIWRYDGITWTEVNIGGMVASDSWGSPSMAVYNGNLYVGTESYLIPFPVTGTDIWKYDGTTWTQVNTEGFGDLNNEASSSMVVYNGSLYVGTWNDVSGTEIWRTPLPKHKLASRGIHSTFDLHYDVVELYVRVVEEDYSNRIYDIEILPDAQQPQWESVEAIVVPLGWNFEKIGNGVRFYTETSPLLTCQRTKFTFRVKAERISWYIRIHVTDQDHQNIGMIISIRRWLYYYPV